MASFNKVVLVGNLTRDPELRVTANELSICKISIAINRAYTTKDGERRDETTYVDIDAFGRQAEVISKYMHRGRPILVEGRLKLDQWESDGQKRSKLGIVLENFQFLGGREEEDRTTSGDSYAQSSPPVRSKPDQVSESTETNFSNDEDTLDDDVPF